MSSLLTCEEKVANSNPWTDLENVSGCMLEIPSPQQQLLLRCLQTRPLLEDCTGQLLLTVIMRQRLAKKHSPSKSVQSTFAKIKGKLHFITTWIPLLLFWPSLLLVMIILDSPVRARNTSGEPNQFF